MQKQTKKSTLQKISPLVLIVVSLLFICFFYGKILIHPNNYLFSSKGDGMKNYYTYAYHISNDTSYEELQGMNYPYGENFLYTDCHPLFTIVIKGLSGVFPAITLYSVGFINFLMVFSFLITALLVYKIFMKLKLHPVISLIGAFGITLLSPQIFRMTGHFALSYSFLVPLTWLLFIKFYESSKKIKWSVLLFLNNTFWFFIHAYLGMIAASFLFFILLFDFLYNIKLKYSKFTTYLPFIIGVVFPVFFFNFIITSTDIHTGRTSNPLGFFLYNAELDDIFVPNHPPFKLLLDKIFIIKQNWEGWSYVGICSVVAFIVFIILTTKNAIITKKITFYNYFFKEIQLKIALMASLILLLYAFGIPFKQFRFLLEWFPLFKSFRATGRFAWVFYFVFTISSIYFLNNIIEYLKEQKKNTFAYILAIFLPILYVIEGWTYHNELSKEMTSEVNLFDREQLNKEYRILLNAIESKDYQAIIPIPFYYHGSDNYERPVKDEILKKSMLISYYTKLPIFSAYLTRIAIPESKKIVQLISPDFYEKPIEKDLKNKKPFLVIKSNEELSVYEQDIINKSRLFCQSPSLSLYKLEYSNLFQNNAISQIDSFNAKRNKLFLKSDFFVSDSTAFFYYNDFSNNKCEKYFSGTGGIVFKKQGKYTIVGFPPNTFRKDKEYVVSAWMCNAIQSSLGGWYRFVVEEYNVAENKWTTTWCLPNNSEVINGDWSLVELKFKINNPQNNISIVTVANKFDKGIEYLDDLLVKEANTDIYKIIKQDSYGKISELFKNNHRIIVKK